MIDRKTFERSTLLAYKVAKAQEINIYTVLVVSCKKSDSDAWALMTRDVNIKDPNADWHALHIVGSLPACRDGRSPATSGPKTSFFIAVGHREPTASNHRIQVSL